MRIAFLRLAGLVLSAVVLAGPGWADDWVNIEPVSREEPLGPQSGTGAVAPPLPAAPAVPIDGRGLFGVAYSRANDPALEVRCFAKIPLPDDVCRGAIRRFHVLPLPLKPCERPAPTCFSQSGYDGFNIDMEATADAATGSLVRVDILYRDLHEAGPMELSSGWCDLPTSGTCGAEDPLGSRGARRLTRDALEKEGLTGADEIVRKIEGYQGF